MEIVKAKGNELLPLLNIDHLVVEWGNYLAKEFSSATKSAYEKGIHLFIEWLSDNQLQLSHISPSDIVNWREDLKVEFSAQTVNLRLTAVRRFYAWLVEQGAPMANPASNIRGASRRGTTSRHKRDELTSTEVLRVIQTCGRSLSGDRDRAIISLMAYCALRTVEIQRASISDLQTKDDRLILWVQGKGHSEADDFVVLPVAAEDAILSWLSTRGEESGPLFISLSNRSYGHRLSLRAIRGIVKERYRIAGVAGAQKTTHSLRHSAITSAIRNGATPLQVQAMARHKSFDTTLGYYHEVGRTASPAEDLIKYS